MSSKLLDKIKASKQALAAKGGRERPMKLSSAKNIIRILPNWAGQEDGDFHQSFGQHFIKDGAGNVQAVYVCTASTFGKECRVCSDIARINATTTDESILEILKESRGSSRVLVNAIYRSGTHANAKTEPVLLEMPDSVMKNVFDIMVNYMEDHDLNILSLTEGYDLVVSKEGSGRETKYTVTPSPKPSAVDAAAMGKCRDLAEYAQQEYEAGESKARAALSAVTGGPAMPTLAGPAATPARAALAAPAPAPSAAATLAAATPVDFDVAEIEAAVVAIEEALPAAVVAADPEPVLTPAPAAVSVLPSTDDIDADLAELDALLNEAA